MAHLSALNQDFMIKDQNNHQNDHRVYTPIAFDERVTFWLQRAGSLSCACAFAALHACAIAYWLYASLRAMPTCAHAHHKAVTGRPDALKPKSYSLVEGNQTIVGFKRA